MMDFIYCLLAKLLVNTSKFLIVRWKKWLPYFSGRLIWRIWAKTWNTPLKFSGLCRDMAYINLYIFPVYLLLFTRLKYFGLNIAFCLLSAPLFRQLCKYCLCDRIYPFENFRRSFQSYRCQATPSTSFQFIDSCSF